MKKLNLLLLFLFSVISLNINAHDFEVVNSDGKTIYYDVISSANLTVEVTYQGNSYSRYSNEYEGAITIPSSVSYSGKTYSVTSIGDDAFRVCSDLTSITIPNSVTSLGNYAFWGCSGLTSVTIPNSVTSLGNYAFRDCSGLTSVTIPNSVTSLGNYAFWGCSGLTSVTIPNSVTSIGDYAFRDCSGLTSVTIPNSVTSIGASAFAYCSGLTSVTIPNSVTSIGYYAFYGCSGLTSVTIPNSVTSIGYEAFRGCSGLKELTLEDGEEKLSFGSNVFSNAPLESVYLGRSLSYPANSSDGYSPFYNKTTLTSLTIGNSVTSIGGYAFDGCSGLTSVTIPNSVISIGSYAFGGCSGLTSVTIPNSVTSIRASAFDGCSGLTSVTIPNSVTSIGDEAFKGCSGLTSVTIPNSVTLIGDEAFKGCSGLKELTLEDGEDILSFGSYVFDETPLESVYLGRSLSNASSSSSSLFYNRTTLTSLTIGNSVTSIGDYAFSGCSGLKKLVIENGEEILTLGRNQMDEGLFYDCPLESVYLERDLSYDTPYSPFYNMSTLTTLTIGNSVTSIGGYAFAYCSGLTSVTIPNSVTSIGYYAFYKCSDLTSVTIPNSVTSIGDDAFAYCSGLTSVTIPNSVTSIGDDAFRNCSGLISVTIPNSVTSIGRYAFSGCSGLKELTLEDGEDILSFDLYVFSNAPLESVYLGRDLSYSESPTINKTTLTSVTIGNSVTSIGNYAFAYCSGLTSVTIPNSVISIGSYAFGGCSGLTEIYSLSSIPAECDVYTFWGVDKTIPVYIPYGSISAYKSAPKWKDFKNFIESEFTGVEGEVISTSDIKVISGNGIEVSDYYGRIRIVNLAGQVIKDVYVNGYIQLSLPKGIYIVVTENSSQKVIL